MALDSYEFDGLYDAEVLVSRRSEASIAMGYPTTTQHPDGVKLTTVRVGV